MSLQTVLLVALLAISASSVPAPPKDIIETDEFYGPIKKCPKGLNDEELSQCLTDIINDMKSMFADGIPEIDLKSIDPFKMDKFDFTLNLRPIIINTKFNSVVLRHLTKWDDAKFKLNMAAKTMEFEFSAPTIRAEANWALSGNIPVIFQLIGSGNAWIDISGGKVRGRTNFKIGTGPNGKEILQMDRLVLDLDYDDSKVQINNIFGNHPTLSRAGPLINRLANDYQKEMYHIIKPQFGEYVADIVKEIANKAFANMPFMTEYF